MLFLIQCLKEMVFFKYMNEIKDIFEQNEELLSKLENNLYEIDNMGVHLKEKESIRDRVNEILSLVRTTRNEMCLLEYRVKKG